MNSNYTQIIYVDFSGGKNLFYDNNEYSRSVEMSAANFTAEEQLSIITTLNEQFGNGVVFTAEKPTSGDYSTIYVGETNSFDDLGSFAGLAETIDVGNLIKNDKAFVNTALISSLDEVISVIAHESGHLMGKSHPVTTNTIQDFAATITTHTTISAGGTQTCYNNTYQNIQYNPSGANKNGAAFVIESTKTPVIKGVLTGGNSYFYNNIALTGHGGAIGCHGILTLAGCRFTQNTAAGCGGAIYIDGNYGGECTLSGIFSFSDNTAYQNGGAIYVGSNTTINFSAMTGTFSGNKAPTSSTAGFGLGGAISNNSTITMAGGTFTQNTAANGGGAIHNTGTLTLSEVSYFFNENEASSGSGGAICNASGTVALLSGGTFSGNTASASGGAIYNNGLLTLSGNNLFSNNKTNGEGGAISNVDTAVITGSTFAGNTATFAGGAIFNTHNIAISGSTFNENTATTYGGAIGNTGIVFISDSTFSGNTAAYGGAIYNMGIVSFIGEVTLGTETDTIFNSNAGTLNWNLTGDDTTGKLNGYQWLTNAGALSITVKEETSDTFAYSIATGNFTDVTGKDTFTLTGLAEYDDITISIGDTASYGGRVYYLHVVNGNNLVLSNYNDSNIYVNSTYSGEIGTITADGHILGYDAFNNYTEAKAACVSGSTIIQTGGSFDSNVALDGKTLVVNAGEETKMLTGGKAISNEITVWQHETGNTSVTVNDGLFKNFYGADIVSNGSAARNGNVELTINGGTFASGASGGMFFRTAERSTTEYDQDTVWLTGDIDFTIKGGIFQYNVFGGNASVDTNHPTYFDASSCTVVEGDITLTLDASTKDLTFNNDSSTTVVNVFAGSAGKGSVNGTTTVVVKGSHDIVIEGALSGGSRADYVAIQGETRTMHSNVSGSRTLEFSGFNKGSGIANTLDCKLFMFDTMVFKDDSIVELTYSSNFQDVENWTFEEGSSADIGNANNSFAGDTLNFTSLDDLEAGEKWKVLTAKESSLDILNASAVNFDNVAASKTEFGWEWGDYTLSIADSADAGMKDMIITRSLA